MPVKGEVKVWNHENKELEGPEENGSSKIFEFDYSIHQPYDPITMRIQGSARIDEFRITKEIDKLTPLLLGIASKGIICGKVVITLYQITQLNGGVGGGREEPYYEYTLEEVRFSQIRNHMASIIDASNEATGHMEDIYMIAERHNWKYLDGNVEEYYPPDVA